MERILVIDDNTRDRSLLRDALERQGYAVEETANGRQADRGCIWAATLRLVRIGGGTL
jgi:CheY-like chemotaxis protein